jgi:hypothetical protein
MSNESKPKAVAIAQFTDGPDYTLNSQLVNDEPIVYIHKPEAVVDLEGRPEYSGQPENKATAIAEYSDGPDYELKGKIVKYPRPQKPCKPEYVDMTGNFEHFLDDIENKYIKVYYIELSSPEGYLDNKDLQKILNSKASCLVYEGEIYRLNEIDGDNYTYVNIIDTDVGAPIIKEIKLNIKSGYYIQSVLVSEDIGIVQGYFYNGEFYKDSEHTQLYDKVRNQGYIDLPTDFLYYYNGSKYISITLAPATSIKYGSVKLYNELGSNEDGTITQKAITDSLNEIKGLGIVDSYDPVNEELVFTKISSI